MDENGKAVMAANCAMSYKTFDKPGYPKVKQDLDELVTFFAEKYGSVLYPAVKKHTANMVAIPLYDPPVVVVVVAKGIGPYCDILWTRFVTATRVQQVYNEFRKPVLNSEYIVADHDSPLNFGGPITALSYDRGRDRTIITFSGVPYRFVRAYEVEFPDMAASAWSASPCGQCPLHPIPTKIGWRTVEVAGNYTRPGCLQLGQRVRNLNGTSEWSGTPEMETQAHPAEAIKEQMEALINAKGG